MYQELTPGALNRQRLDLPAVTGQSACLNQATAGEQVDRAAICRTIERDRQLQISGIDAERRTGDRHPLGISSELEFRRRRSETGEVELSIAQNRSLAVGTRPCTRPAICRISLAPRYSQ